jgi:hypothetical protein
VAGKSLEVTGDTIVARAVKGYCSCGETGVCSRLEFSALLVFRDNACVSIGDNTGTAASAALSDVGNDDIFVVVCADA